MKCNVIQDLIPLYVDDCCSILHRVAQCNGIYRHICLQILKRIFRILAKYISYIIATLNHDRSLHDLLNPYDKIKAHLAKYHEDQKAAGIRLV